MSSYNAVLNAENSMILTQGFLQVQQVKLSNEKVDDEIRMSERALQDMQAAERKAADQAEKIKKAQAKQKEERKWLLFAEIALTVIASIFASPAVALLMVTMLALNTIPIGHDKNGNDKTAMSELKTGIANGLGGDNAKNEVWASVITTVAIVALGAGFAAAGAAISAGMEEGASLSLSAAAGAAIKSSAPIIFAQAVGGGNLFGSIANDIIQSNPNIKNNETWSTVVMVTAAVLSVAVMLAAAKFQATSGSSASILSRIAGKIGKSTATVTEAVAAAAEEEGIEMQTIASNLGYIAENAGSGAANVVAREAATQASAFSRVISKLGNAAKAIGEVVRSNPQIALTGVMVAAMLATNGIQIWQNIDLGDSFYNQKIATTSWGHFQRVQFRSDFGMKIANALIDAEQKEIRTRWSAQSSVQNVYSHFAAADAAIANAFLAG